MPHVAATAMPQLPCKGRQCKEVQPIKLREAVNQIVNAAAGSCLIAWLTLAPRLTKLCHALHCRAQSGSQLLALA